ncbi:PadR family transcriptional regulator [Merdibacter massiliensis]|uniref:PadR family transcriptional regulator n=1 Tax=Merdibacter massiliensis TaxID=1871030 RepID=UPI00192A31AA|nr:PadR family transcriptional regulator [Merdibacter massiliensis]
MLQYAILGMLERQSMTGYELKKQFESTLFEFWPAKHSQIYPELKNLTEKGWIEYSIEITGNVLEKKKYRITESGREAWFAWEKQAHPEKVITKDAFRLQLFFSDLLKKEEQFDLLKEQQCYHEQYLQELTHKMQGFACVPPSDKEQLSDYMVLLGAIYREKAICEWLTKCMAMVMAQER